MGIIEIEKVFDMHYKNVVVVIHQIWRSGLENSLEHPQHILEKVFDDEIISITNIKEETD